MAMANCEIQIDEDEKELVSKGEKLAAWRRAMEEIDGKSFLLYPNDR